MQALLSSARRRSRIPKELGSEIFLAAAGLGWIFMGALVLGVSSSATHEITAALLASFGVMFIGLSGLLSRVRTLNVAAPMMMQPAVAEPPPVPVEYSLSIEDAISDVRTSVRHVERQAWVDSFNAGRAEPVAPLAMANPYEVADQYDVAPQYEVAAQNAYDANLNRLSYLRGGVLPPSLLIEDGRGISAETYADSGYHNGNLSGGFTVSYGNGGYQNGHLNGPSLNSPPLNGPPLSVPSLAVPSLNGQSLNGHQLNVPSLNSPSLNGPSLNGAYQSEEYPNNNGEDGYWRTYS
jgi:hypothetical protein